MRRSFLAEAVITCCAGRSKVAAAVHEVVDAHCDSLTNRTCADCPIPYLTIGTTRPAGEPA